MNFDCFWELCFSSGRGWGCRWLFWRDGFSPIPDRSGAGFRGLRQGAPHGPAGEPSPPLSPSHATGASSTLRAFKGEGEIRTEAEAGAKAPASASSSLLGRREGMIRLWRTGSPVGVMEGPGRLRMMPATPVPMRGVRPWGRFTSATALRQPLTSEGMWTRREGVSLWGSLDHQKCSTIPRDGSGDP